MNWWSQSLIWMFFLNSGVKFLCYVLPNHGACMCCWFFLKVTWAQNNGLQGVFIWNLGVDDVQGYCGPKFPLLSAVNQALVKPNVVPTVRPAKAACDALRRTSFIADFLLLFPAFILPRFLWSHFDFSISAGFHEQTLWFIMNSSFGQSYTYSA